jgi:ribosomal-protein-alanine N-acetyltransferase
MKPSISKAQFSIRDYRAADFNRLWEIDQLCFAPGIAYTQMDLTGFLASRGKIALVAECDAGTQDKPQTSRIAGFIVAHRRGQVGRVLTIDVLPEARGYGLGTRLMNECEGRLRTAGCSHVLLETAVNNEAALRLYSKLGYEILGIFPEYYASHSLDAFRMGKQL